MDGCEMVKAVNYKSVNTKAQIKGGKVREKPFSRSLDIMFKDIRDE